MPERDGFQTFGQLVVAIGEEWFAHTLRGALQMLFHHDYTLIAHYRRGVSLRVLQSNLDGPQARQAVRYLETETYVLEPIFRLFAAHSITAGVFDMAELVAQAAAMPPSGVAPESLPHLIEDDAEEIGWRTLGWPRHQQETCVLMPLDKDELLAVSLYNVGAQLPGLRSDESLRRAWPLLNAILVKHGSTPAGRLWGATPSTQSDPHPRRIVADVQRVKAYFQQVHNIDLTDREGDVFACLLQGETLPATAERLNMSMNTLKTHRRNVYRRLGSGKLPELINRFHHFLELSDKH